MWHAAAGVWREGETCVASNNPTHTTRARLAVVLHIALRALTRHWLRSTRTTLGMRIGVHTLLCRAAVGQGAARAIEER
jgi:hypothetical protein